MSENLRFVVLFVGAGAWGWFLANPIADRWGFWVSAGFAAALSVLGGVWVSV